MQPLTKAISYSFLLRSIRGPSGVRAIRPPIDSQNSSSDISGANLSSFEAASVPLLPYFSFAFAIRTKFLLSTGPHRSITSGVDWDKARRLFGSSRRTHYRHRHIVIEVSPKFLV